MSWRYLTMEEKMTIKEIFAPLMEEKSARMDRMFACALANLFENENEADTLVEFLMKFKKYGSKKEQIAIQNFIEGINFYKEKKIFFGEEE